MKNIVLLIALSILISCNSKNQKDVLVFLNVEKTKDCCVLIVEIKNNTGYSIYINKIGGPYLYENLNIINVKYAQDDDDFIYDELLYNKIKSKTKVDVCDSLNNSKDFYTELEDLERIPFTSSKNLIKAAINSEYQDLIIESNPKLLTENDISLIKSLILFKYQGTIFLKPKEVYKQYISINSLDKNSYSSKLIFNYCYDDKVDELEVNLEYTNNSIIVNSIPIEKIGKYKLFKGNFKSDTLYIN